MTTRQKAILRSIIKRHCFYGGSKNDAAWLEQMTGIPIQRDNVRGEGPCIYALFDSSSDELASKAQSLLNSEIEA